MPLSEELNRSGIWLFRWRSYLPLILLALVLTQIPHYSPFAPGWESAWEGFCLALGFLGLGIRALVVGYTPAGTSGRNTDAQEASVLNTQGMYSLVRHPLYLGNFLLWIAVPMFLHSAWLVLLIALLFALYYERIMFAEESYLREKFGKPFEEWAEPTPLIFPRTLRWQRPTLPFSFRNVLRREYAGLFGFIATLTLLEVLGDWVTTGRPGIGTGWAILFGASLATFLLLRHLKRHSQLLRVSGR